jgi:hypothetical protein
LAHVVLPLHYQGVAMVGKRSRTCRPIRLGSRALFAAERLAEIAGVPATELVEMVLLELAASGEILEADAPAKRPRSTPFARDGSAQVVPIERGHRRRPVPIGSRVEALRRRSEAARIRGEAAREASVDLRVRCRSRPGAAW